MDKETLFVIDGHKLEIESNEFSTSNDIRQIYDANLQQTYSKINDTLKQTSFENLGSNEIKIKLNKDERNINITNGIIFEFITGKNLEISLFKDKERIFNVVTNADYELDRKHFGTQIEHIGNNVHYFSDGNSTVFSNLTTNKIIKYSSTENIDGNLYTKYYEYFEKCNCSIYILMANFKPVSLTCYNHKMNNSKNSFIFE